MTVRIPATDWMDGGISGGDAVEIARLFAAAGAFAAAIRNAAGVPTIAVGVISSYDDVNSILLAGRADLCALGRVHLYDPNWTLHAAVEQDYAGPGAQWPDPWKAGRRKPQGGRTDGPRPRLQLIRDGEPTTRHARRRP